MAIYSCKDCTERKLGCHATCEKYIKDKMEHDKLKELIKKEEDVDNCIMHHKCLVTTSQLKKYGTKTIH